MKTTTRKNFEHLKEEIEKEFPEDPALQQIHLARKILAREAEKQKLTYFEYVRSLEVDTSGRKTSLTYQEFESEKR